jgi:hypothetical protein
MRLVAASLLLLILAACGAPDSAAPAQLAPASYLPVVMIALRTPAHGPGGPKLTATPTRTPTATPTPTSGPTPTFGPTPTPTLPPPTFNGCLSEPHPEAAPNYPIRIVAIDKVKELVTLTNVTTANIDLTLWYMCAMTTHWSQGVGGTLAPGQTYTYGPSNQDVWNDMQRDDGALYNTEGQLVSYWYDR